VRYLPGCAPISVLSCFEPALRRPYRGSTASSGYGADLPEILCPQVEALSSSANASLTSLAFRYPTMTFFRTQWMHIPPNPDRDLTGQTVVVTGASQGAHTPC
jgi:hypothetical protein